MNPILAAAKDYLGRGWSVIPIVPGAKKPLIPWAEFQKRHATDAELDAWWAKYPDANVGIVTGRISGLVVVDIDVDRGGNPETVYKDTPSGMVAQTGSGGYHLFYSYPSDAPSVGNQVRDDGIDVRGDGGYVVAAPSTHSSGQLYQWKLQGGLVTPPKWTYKPKESSLQKSPDGSEGWITTIMQTRMGEGDGRNNAVARLAGYFAGKGIPKDVASGVINTWNMRNLEPLGLGEINQTIDSVYRTASRRLVEIPEATDLQPANIPHERLSDPKFPLMALSNYMLKFGDEQVKWLIEDWFPDETIAFMVAPPGHYKTWLLLDLAVAVSGGKPFLGDYKVEKTGPVIIIQQEDHHGQLVERLATIIHSRYPMGDGSPNINDEFNAGLPPDLPIYFHPDRMLRFDKPEVVTAFAKQIAALKPALVIIDPLYSVGGTDDYLAKTAENMFVLKQMRDRFGCSFLVSHHAKKGATGGREGMWGSQFLNAFLETGWQIRSDEGEMSIKLQRHFKVKGAMAPLKLEFDINTHGVGARYGVDISKVEAGTNDKTENLILGVLKKRPLKAAEIAKELKVHRSTISRALKKMEQKNKIRQILDGSWEVESPQF